MMSQDKSRCILKVSIIHVDTFHGSKGDFPVSCAVTSFKIRNHYLVVSLIVAVHLAEDCCTSSMKLLSSQKSSTLYRLP